MVFNWLKKILKKVLPDGRVKNFLIYINHKIHAKDCKIKYSFKDKTYIAKFYSKPFHGESVIFPDISFKTICGVPRETPPYFFNEYITEGSIVVDAGAFPGDFTVLAAKIAGCRGRVLSLEPNPENREYLKKMLRANGIAEQVELLPYALSDNNAGVSLVKDSIFSRVIEGNQEKKILDSSVIVPTISIDELLKQRNLLNGSDENIVIKMDIEGAELAAFDGARQSLEQGVKFIIAAYHIVNGQRTADVLEDKLKQNGYTVSLVNPSHLTLVAEKNNLSHAQKINKIKFEKY